MEHGLSRRYDIQCLRLHTSYNTALQPQPTNCEHCYTDPQALRLEPLPLTDKARSFSLLCRLDRSRQYLYYTHVQILTMEGSCPCHDQYSKTNNMCITKHQAGEKEPKSITPLPTQSILSIFPKPRQGASAPLALYPSNTNQTTRWKCEINTSTEALCNQ